MKTAVAVAAVLALLVVGCPLGVVLLVAPATGAGVGVHAAAAQAVQLAGSGQLRPDAAVPEPYLPLVLAAGQVCAQIGPAHIAAQIEVESGWNPNAYTDAGEVPAHGIAQFTMPTWESWGGDYDVESEPTAAGPRLVITGGDQPGDPYQPANAIIAQAHLMCDLHRWAESQLAAGRLAGATALDLAWAAYFCGRGCILDHAGIPPGGLAAEYPGKVRAALSRYATVGHVAVDGWVHPLPPGSYTLTSGFGMRWGRLHAGIDLAAATGTPIHAAADGVVLDAGCTSPRCDVPGSRVMPGCDPLTAPTGPGLVCLFPFRRTGWVVAPVDVYRVEGERCVGGTSLRDLLREGRWEVPAVGAVVVGEVPSLPYLVVDGAGEAVEPVSRYLRDLTLSDRSRLTVRSYAMDLLRWWRMLGMLEVGWDVATTDEVAVLVGWLRHAPNPQRRGGSGFPGGVNVKTGKRTSAAGYAPSTINHALSVLSGFYAFHAYYGRGPVVNPVPPQARRRAVLAHRSPLEPVARLPRAPLRQRTSVQSPRVIADPLWQELFDAMTCVRDRALLACYVSSGARASELLGMHAEHVDWAGQRLWVLTKGTRLLEPVPASPLAFTLLALYFEQDGAPAVGQPVWRTRRGQSRALTYWAARRILQRANAKLGTNWSLHDTRHTAATRMVNDPALTLPEVQTVMRHAHLATTQRYLGVDVEDLVAKMQRHYQRPAQAQPMTAVGYAPEDVATVFGG